MPTYEYKCRQCGYRFEVVQSFTAEPLRKCEECGGELGKVFGNIGITFKGSGFYRTDSRASTKSTNGKDASESKSGSESKSDSSSGDSKATAKSETKSDSAKTSTATKDKGSS